MRMWMLPTSILCSKHLGGEHYELHQAVGLYNKGSLRGRNKILSLANKGFLELHNMQTRHAELTREMNIRKGRDKNADMSPLPGIRYYGELGQVSLSLSWWDLLTRCPACRNRTKQQFNYIYKCWCQQVPLIKE